MKCAHCRTEMVPSVTEPGVLVCPVDGSSVYQWDAALSYAPLHVPAIRPLTPPTPEELSGAAMTGTCAACSSPCRERATYCLKCRVMRDLVISTTNERKRKAQRAGVQS